MPLTATNSVIQAVLAGSVSATEPDYFVVWTEHSNDGTFLDTHLGAGSLTGTTPKEIMGGSTTTQVGLITLAIYNRDSANVTVTVQHGGGQKITTAVLEPNGSLHYENHRGWYTKMADGSEKVLTGSNQSYRKNSTGSVLTRPRLNVIEGTGVTLTLADDSGDNEVDLTIAAPGATGGTVTEVATAGLATGGPITSTGTVTVTAATAADQETATSATTAVTPSVQHRHPSACKGWVDFDGTGTPAINASYNVDSSITDNDVGDWTIAWTTDFSSATYCAVISVNRGEGSNTQMMTTIHTKAAGSLRVNVTDTDPSFADVTSVNIAAFGDQ